MKGRIHYSTDIDGAFNFDVSIPLDDTV